MSEGLPYFYDGQIRRIILHFMRVFQGFKVKSGRDSQGYVTPTNVPVMWGDGSRQVHHVLNGNAENVLQSNPRISCYITGMAIDRSRSRWQGTEEDVLVNERQFDEDANEYTDKIGNSYHVKRLATNPVNLNMQVDIWTSNLEQRLQLFEQIFMIFNPLVEIQTTSNPLDWTSVSRVILEDIDWDGQGVPKGTEDELMVMSLRFLVEADINTASRVKKQTLINTIIQQIGDGNSKEDTQGWGPGDAQQIVVTPNNHTIGVLGNEIILLDEFGNTEDENGNKFSWPQLFDLYGELRENCSKILLRRSEDIEDDSMDILGFVSYHPTEDNVMLIQYDAETFPAVTVDPYDQMIDPHSEVPDEELPALALGQRYLITDEIGAGSETWGSLVASENDIIEYDGVNWIVAFDSSTGADGEVSVDNSSGSLVTLKNNQWEALIDGKYDNGYFRIIV